MSTTVPKATVLALCAKYGPQLHVPAGLVGSKVLYALAGNESTWGENCTPRHEPAYDVGGSYAKSGITPVLLAKYGSAAAASYGPWQIMAVNAPQFSPAELESDPEKCAQATVQYINSFVLHFRGASTLQQIAETYNSGKFTGQLAPGVLKYGSDAAHYYASAP